MLSKKVEMENKSNSMRFRMFLSVFLGSAVMIISGTNMVWTSPLMKKLKDTEDNPLGQPLTDNESSWLTSISVLGGMAGCFLFGALSQQFSRRILLVVVCAPFLTFFLTMAFARVLWLFFFARFMSGVSMGGALTLLPPYICEIADPKIRGKLCVTIGVCRNLGLLITYCTGPFLSFYWYHISLATLPITIATLLFLFAVEGPYHIFRSNPAEAERILRELRGKYDVTEELNEIKRGMDKIPGSGFLEVFNSKSTMRSLLIGVGLTFFTQFTGYLVLISFAVFVFDAAGGSWSSETDTIVIGVVEVTTAFFASAVTDLFDRKTQFIASYALAALCQFVLGGYFVLQDNGSDLSSFGWVPVLSMAGYFITYDLGMGILTQTLLGELFSPAVKSSAVALCQIVGATVGFVITLFFERVQDAIGDGQSFWIFAAFSISGAVFVKLLLVETRGKTLEEVQDDIDNS